MYLEKKIVVVVVKNAECFVFIRSFVWRI